jgi:hypothetical protein
MEKQHSGNGNHSSKMKFIRIVSLCWLVLLAGFLGGIYVYATEIWPYPILKDIKDFVAGHEEEKTSLAEKLENDLGIKPSRHIVTSAQLNETLGQRGALRRKESQEFRNFFREYGQNLKELRGLPLLPRRKNPRIFLSEDAPRGYRVIYGVFGFQKTLHGVILLDPAGNVANVWQTSQEEASWSNDKDSNVYPHGFEIAPDGSIVTAYDGGTSLTKYDYCGNKVWTTEGYFHHSIAFEDSTSLWTWQNNSLVRIDYETGKILHSFNLSDVMQSNPFIDIFAIIQDYDGNWIGNSWFYWHPNDIEPLPKEYEKYYPQFKAGDLLVSVRQPNLVFVMDPNTLKVKWWRQGLARRPHDPDWNDKGTITIFNNNSHRGYSNIMELHPTTMAYDMVVDGHNYQFYSTIRGTHQLEPTGSYLITSSNQGRVFEVGSNGNVTFEFLNVWGSFKNREGYIAEEYLAISDARFLPENFFKELPVCD